MSITKEFIDWDDLSPVRPWIRLKTQIVVLNTAVVNEVRRLSTGSWARDRYLLAVMGLVTWMNIASNCSRADENLTKQIRPFVDRYCSDCHGSDQANAGVNFSRSFDEFDLSTQFKFWRRMAEVLEKRTMPPLEQDQPSMFDRDQVSNLIRSAIQREIEKHAGDPGLRSLRRLTSAEYGYTVQDLFGLDLKLEKNFVNDAVGGEGFANAAAAQFVEESSLDRYLEAAKIISEHAVIGAGPLFFFPDPGQTGKELSAISRIQQIYRQHGFRTGAGEGAEPFGLDLYSRAFLVAWKYRFRMPLGIAADSLDDIAKQDGQSVRLCRHIWNVVAEEKHQTFPLAMICDQWKAIPPPGSVKNNVDGAWQRCQELTATLRAWQHTLANASGHEEESPALTEGTFQANAADSIKAKIDWNRGSSTATIEFSVSSASSHPSSETRVLWKNGKIRFRGSDGKRGDEKPLVQFLSPASKLQLKLGDQTDELQLGENDFVLRGESKIITEIAVPDGSTTAQLSIDVSLAQGRGAGRMVRCQVADGVVDGETVAESGTSSTLLADNSSEDFSAWRLGIEQFAKLLPQVSQREPAPSDRDPIPAPFDNTYNRPERNHFHTAIKYHRDDRFLTERILDDSSRLMLDQAWTDLLMSFDYHLEMLRFLSRKAGISVPDSIDAWTEDQSRLIPLELQVHAERIENEYRTMLASMRSAQTLHLNQVIDIAAQAWRRSLESAEIDALNAFYQSHRMRGLEHDRSVRLTIARILASPKFLYHAELPTLPDREINGTKIAKLSDREIANRLSYLVWSSLPDSRLIQIAEQKSLSDPDVLAKETRRMLADKRSRRLATEFFGQWLGFYRFDEFRGIDASKFLEFDDGLKSDLYEEAIAFFHHIVQNDRPIHEMLFADYTFLNRRLANHYGLEPMQEQVTTMVQAKVPRSQRGGVLGLGALHAITSAPLRTSAVKRGDWVLRRLLGTPVPPPPADAGSIAAEEVHADGLTVRKRLESHRTSAVCQNCHVRFDPLGFAMENFDSIGRWRDAYADGQFIDSQGEFADGTRIDSFQGLREYLKREQKSFDRNTAVKLVGYALGRSELASDQPLIEQLSEMIDRDLPFSELVVAIVQSKQFLHSRR